MKLSIANKNTTVTVSDEIFAREYNEPLVHQAVTAYLAGGRAGTKANKSRSDVRGGGAKPWRQKGTGRARAGTLSSPIWRSGGVTFAARPRNYKQKLNKKMVRAAYASMFSELSRQGRLHVVEDFTVTEPKTKQALENLKKLSLSSALIITEEADKNLYLSVRNLPHVDVTEVGGIDPVSLLKYKNVVVTKDALEAIEEWLQ
ncbi:MAG: 50S ribosomal protein L4 [Gammaproteobacteria bacterium]|nr:50S ribosomal protein L4 [Gammaproteobacteria bacterium]